MITKSNHVLEVAVVVVMDRKKQELVQTSIMSEMKKTDIHKFADFWELIYEHMENEDEE